MESFHRPQLAGLALICLKNETMADAERDLRDLSPLPARMCQRRHRERLLRHLDLETSAPARISKVLSEPERLRRRYLWFRSYYGAMYFNNEGNIHRMTVS